MGVDWGSCVAIVSCVSSVAWLGYTFYVRHKIYEAGVIAGYKQGLQTQMITHVMGNLSAAMGQGGSPQNALEKAIAEATRKREAGGSN